MRSELERRGIPNRGTAYTSKQLRAMLKDAGLDLDVPPEDRAQDWVDR